MGGRVRLVILMVLVLSMGPIACGDVPTDEALAASGTERPGDSSAPSSPPASLPAPALTLYVSNQSFEDPAVEIIITIDGEVTVGQAFKVEGQEERHLTFEISDEPIGFG